MKQFYLFIGAMFFMAGSHGLKAQSYCSPSYNLGCSLADNSITNFTLTGDDGSVINNDSDCTSGSFGFGGGYADYSSLNPAILTPGESYQGSVSSGFSVPATEKVKIWIDWDNDGTFGTDEVVGLIDGIDVLSGTSTFSFTVPADASPGTKRLRVRLVSGASVNSIDPCSSEDIGEAEDYSVVVDQSCIEPSLDGITITPLFDDWYDFVANNAENADDYLWDFGNGETSTDENPSYEYTESGTYTVTVTITNECGEESASTVINHSSVGLSKNELTQLNLYPNPTQNSIRIVGEATKDIQSIKVYNLIGSKVYEVNTALEQLDFSSFENGIYIVHVAFTNGEVIQRKIEKQ